MLLFVAILYSQVEKAYSSLKLFSDANALMKASCVRSSDLLPVPHHPVDEIENCVVILVHQPLVGPVMPRQCIGDDRWNLLNGNRVCAAGVGGLLGRGSLMWPGLALDIEGEIYRNGALYYPSQRGCARFIGLIQESEIAMLLHVPDI